MNGQERCLERFPGSPRVGGGGQGGVRARAALPPGSGSEACARFPARTSARAPVKWARGQRTPRLLTR